MIRAKPKISFSVISAAITQPRANTTHIAKIIQSIDIVFLLSFLCIYSILNEEGLVKLLFVRNTYENTLSARVQQNFRKLTAREIRMTNSITISPTYFY